MAVMRWDEQSQAFVETMEVPKRYDPESDAWVETTGKSWDPEAEAWTERWNTEELLYNYGKDKYGVGFKGTYHFYGYEAGTLSIRHLTDHIEWGDPTALYPIIHAVYKKDVSGFLSKRATIHALVKTNSKNGWIVPHGISLVRDINVSNFNANADNGNDTYNYINQQVTVLGRSNELVSDNLYHTSFKIDSYTGSYPQYIAYLSMARVYDTWSYSYLYKLWITYE